MGTTVAGCEEAREADLLDVRSVGPAELDPGHPLVIEGGPFAIHHEVDVRLVGELARAFVPPESIREDLVAHAVSEERIEVAVSESMLRNHFGRATFRGRVEVREAASWDGMPGAVLGGADDVVIELVPARASASSDRTLDRLLGLRWAVETEHGLAVEHVDADGRAAAAGIVAGDVLVGEGHARFVRGDVPIVPASATSLDLVIDRAGAAERTITVALRAAEETDAVRDRTLLIQLAFLIAWIALLGALPLRSIGYAAPRVAPALKRPTAALGARAAGSLVVAYALVRAAASGTLPAAPAVVAAIVGARATLLFVDARLEIRALAMIVVSSLGLAAGLAALPIAIGTADLAALTHDGSVSPLAWPTFTEPVGPLALAAIAVSLAATRARGRAAQAIDDLVVLAIAALVALEGTGLSATHRSGTIALALTISLTAWCLGHVRGRLGALPATAAIALLIALGGISLSAWTLADPSPIVRAAAAQTLLAMCVTLALTAVRRTTVPRVGARTANALL